MNMAEFEVKEVGEDSLVNVAMESSEKELKSLIWPGSTWRRWKTVRFT
jgi:hypothetical protein